MKEELVSIIIPVYNMADSIEKCIDSLLCQDYKNFEIIIVDDGSTDDSYKICKEYQSIDKRVKVYHTENHGSGPARNYGINKSSGIYAYFPDADDYLEKEAISILVKKIKSEDSDLLVFGYKEINSIGKIKKVKTYPPFLKSAEAIRKDYSDYFGAYSKYNIQGAPWNKLFNLSLIKNNNISYPSLRRHQDEVFISRYMCVSKKIQFISDVLYVHYTNNLITEWKKYPQDYIESVIGLYESRKETILKWNTNDLKIRNMIEKEYLCNFIKALELSFSFKMKFNKKERKKWIISKIEESNIKDLNNPESLGKYQKLILNLIKKEKFNLLYFIFRIKTKIESTNLYTYIRNK